MPSTKEELERNDEIDWRRRRDIRAFRVTTTDRLVHGVAFVGIQKQLIANDVPVIRDCFVRQTIHQKLNLAKEGPADEFAVRIAGREGWQCALEIHVRYEITHLARKEIDLGHRSEERLTRESQWYGEPLRHGKRRVLLKLRKPLRLTAKEILFLGTDSRHGQECARACTSLDDCFQLVRAIGRRDVRIEVTKLGRLTDDPRGVVCPGVIKTERRGCVRKDIRNVVCRHLTQYDAHDRARRLDIVRHVRHDNRIGHVREGDGGRSGVDNHVTVDVRCVLHHSDVARDARQTGNGPAWADRLPLRRFRKVHHERTVLDHRRPVKSEDADALHDRLIDGRDDRLHHGRFEQFPGS